MYALNWKNITSLLLWGSFLKGFMVFLQPWNPLWTSVYLSSSGKDDYQPFIRPQFRVFQPPGCFPRVYLNLPSSAYIISSLSGVKSLPVLWFLLWKICWGFCSHGKDGMKIWFLGWLHNYLTNYQEFMQCSHCPQACASKLLPAHGIELNVSVL
jgi:hypothetical protein